MAREKPLAPTPQAIPKINPGLVTGPLLRLSA
jgi:hypothetical protein